MENCVLLQQPKDISHSCQRNKIKLHIFSGKGRETDFIPDGINKRTAMFLLRVVEVEGTFKIQFNLLEFRKCSLLILYLSKKAKQRPRTYSFLRRCVCKFLYVCCATFCNYITLLLHKVMKYESKKVDMSINSC